MCTRSFADLLLISLTSLALSACVATPSAVEPHDVIDNHPVVLSRLESEGRWFVDEYGRTILIHGGNVSLIVDDAAGLTFGQQTASRMAEQGFNGVRLVIFFSHLMPEPGVVDEGYLSAMADRVTAYSDAGIYVMIDFHQDEYGALVGVRGMPDWAVINGDLEPLPGVEFPLGYFTDPAVQKAFDAFWANATIPQSGKGLQDYYADGLAAVAARFADNSAVLGIDVMNEPATGTRCAKPDPATAHCPELEIEYLQPFYQRASAAITGVASELMVFVEPFMLQGALGIPIDTPIVAPKGRRGLSYHNYGPDNAVRERVDNYALDLARRKSAAIINTEWGFTTNPLDIDAQANKFDRHLISWLAWPRGHFEAVVDLELSSRGQWEMANREGILRAYARPYPVATAGTPLELAFDSNAGHLTYRYSTQLVSGRPAGTELLTEISIPAVQFPEGYRVTAEGAEVVSQPDADRLVLRNAKDATEVLLKISRNGSLPPLSEADDNTRLQRALLKLPPIPDQPLSRHSLLGHILATRGGRDVLQKEMAEGMKGLSHVHSAEQLSLVQIQAFAPHYLTEERLALIELKLRQLEVKSGSVTPVLIAHLFPERSQRLSTNSIVADLLANPEARAIIEHEAPGLIGSKNRGLYPQTTLRNMQPIMPEVLTETVMATIAAALDALK